MGLTHPGRIDCDSASFPVAADVDVHRRVKLDSNGAVSHAGAAEDYIGVAERSVTLASGLPVAVRLNSAPSHVVTASAAIAVGAEVAGAADGKVASGTGTLVALTSASADGDLIIVMPLR